MNGFYLAFKVILVVSVLFLINSIYNKDILLMFLAAFCFCLSILGMLVAHPSEFKHLNKSGK